MGNDYSWAVDPWETPLRYEHAADGVRVMARDGRTVLVRLDPDGELYLDGARYDVGDDYPAWLGLLDEAADALEEV